MRFFELIRLLLLCSFFALFFSCENDIKVINTIGNKDYLPIESAKDVETIYSDSGRVVMLMKAPQLDRFIGQKNYVEMPKGISLFFYDSLKRITGYLTANYAINYEKDKIMEAKNNVVVVNEKNEKLNTEHLVWDVQKGIIYSNKFVKINTGKEILMGEGMESDERFDRWKIKKPKGSITIKEH